jgi:hypothetical protein
MHLEPSLRRPVCPSHHGPPHEVACAFACELCRSCMRVYAGILVRWRRWKCWKCLEFMSGDKRKRRITCNANTEVSTSRNQGSVWRRGYTHRDVLLWFPCFFCLSSGCHWHTLFHSLPGLQRRKREGNDHVNPSVQECAVPYGEIRRFASGAAQWQRPRLPLWEGGFCLTMAGCLRPFYFHWGFCFHMGLTAILSQQRFECRPISAGDTMYATPHSTLSCTELG